MHICRLISSVAAQCLQLHCEVLVQLQRLLMRLLQIMCWECPSAGCNQAGVHNLAYHWEVHSTVEREVHELATAGRVDSGFLWRPASIMLC